MIKDGISLKDLILQHPITVLKAAWFYVKLCALGWRRVLK